ncbi:hypothetical protein C4Q28_12720 [Pseudomonas sp. SWI6]|nr:hypothetical protein C4Q28_12720 [Pseudomonas sp. SWI6]
MLIEFKTDPNVPPLPPHIKLEQAKQFASTLLKGAPNQAGVIVQTAKQVLSSVLPGKKYPTVRTCHECHFPKGSENAPPAARSSGRGVGRGHWSALLWRWPMRSTTALANASGSFRSPSTTPVTHYLRPPSSIQAGAWSLALTWLRTQASTPARFR